MGKVKLPPQLPFSTLEQIQNAVDNIASLNRPWYNVTFGGGEPTIHPHIFDMIKMLHEKLGERFNRIVIISNGSRNPALYERIADLAKLININLTISIHTDHVDMPHILYLIENLSNDIAFDFSVMFNPAKREMVHDIYNTLLEYRKKYWFHMGVSTLFGTIDKIDIRYDEEDFDWQKKANKQFADLTRSLANQFPARRYPKNTFSVFHDVEDGGTIKTLSPNNRSSALSDGLFRFKGMYCIAHASVLRIEENGDCRGMVCNDPVICNIFERNSLIAVQDKLIHAFKCPFNICNCPANDPIPKFISEEEAKKYVEFAQKKQTDLFAEYEAVHSVKASDSLSETMPHEIMSDCLQETMPHEIVGASEDALKNYFRPADKVRKITEYEYDSSDKKSKVVYKVQDGVITEIICSLK